MFKNLKPVLYILLSSAISLIISVLLKFVHFYIGSVLFSAIAGAILFVAILFFIVTIIQNLMRK